jgi:hypothetical protein
VITKELISFAFVGDENQIDYIPLAEIEFVKEMKDIANASASDAGGKADHEDRHRLQIATVLTGYNSGRAYQLSTSSKASLDEILSHLAKNAKAARKRAGTKTLFRMLQTKVRKRYESPLTQGMMAMMIGAVSAAPHPSPPVLSHPRPRRFVGLQGSAWGPKILQQAQHNGLGHWCGDPARRRGGVDACSSGVGEEERPLLVSLDPCPSSR